MTETPKSPARLLAEAAAIAAFRAADGWPDELRPVQFAALMAGGSKGEHRIDFLTFRRMMADSINAGTLATRREPQPPVETFRPAGNDAGFGSLNWLSEFGRVRVGRFETRERPDLHFVSRAQCAAWLHAIGEEPSELVRAWLGNAWQEEAPKPAGDRPASDWQVTAREIGERWMFAEEKRTGKRPSQKQIAAHVEGELSNLDIRGPRGRYLDSETIRREALKGITGRERGENLRR